MKLEARLTKRLTQKALVTGVLEFPLSYVYPVWISQILFSCSSSIFLDKADRTVVGTRTVSSPVLGVQSYRTSFCTVFLLLLTSCQPGFLSAVASNNCPPPGSEVIVLILVLR